MKIRPEVTELFCAVRWTDGQTNMKKLIVALSNFANAPKNDKAVPNLTALN
jgi:hypothetical protein